MEAVSIFLVLGAYIGVRLLLGHHKTPIIRQLERQKAGVRLVEDKRYEEGLEYFNKILEQDSENAVARTYRSICHLHLDNLYQCIADCNKALSIDYSLRDCYLAKGVALYRLEEYAEARYDLDKAIWYFREQHPEAFRYRALCYQALGEEQKATTDFREAARLGDEEANFILLSRGKSFDLS